jgi:iron complex outermembrane recepter protein
MKGVYIMFLLCSFVHSAHTQVSGKLVNGKGNPIPSANVLLLNSSDSILIKAVTSNDSGLFRFDNVNKGAYILEISSSGYVSWHSPVFTLSGTVTQKEFSSIAMEEDSSALKEVVITSEKPPFQQKPEGTIVNVESSVLSKGSTALQVLERSPGVLINHRDNSIELNGKAGVTVMLDGKQMRMSMEQLVTLLSGMSADNIASIELFTTPPAKYDAEGSAGLINIMMKKNKRQGTNGSVSLTGGYGYGEKGMGSINLSHNTNKINVYGSYNYSHNRTYSDMYITSGQHMPFLGGDVYVAGWFNTKLIQNSHDAVIGTDIKINKKITVGANVSLNISNSAPVNFTDAGYNILPDSLLQFTGINKGYNHWTNLANSIYLEKAIRPGEKINISADYLYFNNTNDYEVQSSFIDKHGTQAGTNESLFAPGQKGFADTRIQVGVAKLDYTRELNKKTKLETGIKGAYTRSVSLSGIESLVNGVWTGSEATSNNIVMKEGIGAVYASVNSQLNPSTNLTIGARYEYSNTNMDNATSEKNITHRKLGAFFPGIFFSKKINDKSTLSLSYTKRISRPSYNDLASYVAYSDPTAVYTGNPFLQPTITHNIKLGYNYNGYAFSLLFSRDRNAISRYQLSESPAHDILFISPKNLPWQNYLTLQATLPFKVSDWWTMNYSLLGGLRQYKVDHVLYPFQNTYWAYSFNFSQIFKLPADFTAEVSGRYNSTSYNGTVRIKGYGVLNAGIKKELKKNGGSFQLSVSDILRSERINVFYGTLTQEAFSIQSHVHIITESAKFPIFKLTYGRSFGRNKAKVQRLNNADDEQNRIRKE